MPASTYTSPVAKARIARIAKALTGASMDAPTLAKATHGCLGVTRHFLTYLHKRKFVYISGWSIRMFHDRPTGQLYPRYSWGLGVDEMPVSVISARPEAQ